MTVCYSTAANMSLHIIVLLGSAKADDDYTMISMDLTFPVNSEDGATQCLNVTVLMDFLVEGNETFTVTLTLMTAELGVTLGDTTLTNVTITDNEGIFCDT